jgi:hypothetical protein
VPLGIHCVPGSCIATGLLDLIYQADHFLPQEVVDNQRHMCGLRYLIGDGGARVEGVRPGDGQREGTRNVSPSG